MKSAVPTAVLWAHQQTTNPFAHSYKVATPNLIGMCGDTVSSTAHLVAHGTNNTHRHGPPTRMMLVDIVHNRGVSSASEVSEECHEHVWRAADTTYTCTHELLMYVHTCTHKLVHTMDTHKKLLHLLQIMQFQIG